MRSLDITGSELFALWLKEEEDLREMKEELADMRTQKAVHDVQAKKEVRRLYWLLFYGLVGFNATMMYFTWELYSWDVVGLNCSSLSLLPTAGALLMHKLLLLIVDA